MGRIKIVGDDIFYEGILAATIENHLLATTRENFIDTISKSHEELHQKSYNQGYKECAEEIL